jgi:hypothetical protein
MRKIYKINRADAPSVYVATKKELYAWSRRNPGEMESWEEVDPIEHLRDLAVMLDAADREVDKLKRLLYEYEQ